ncbi:MAG TPA: phenylalanine 4-monooxygenase [Blastocatellia bacterium]|nr:phenylalanine 4-monooxygenase [Blastocatellia bacterium]
MVTTQNATITANELNAALIDDVGFEEISLLPIDHPGAHDPDYRARRNFIAALARQYREDPQHVVPLVEYTPEEREVWRHVCCQLEKVQARRACSFYLEAKKQLGISCLQIPQLRDLNEKLQKLNNFRVAPIEGLVETRAFLSWLSKRTMLCTQYVRHHSRPEYTPEPDVVHEFIGHIPAFTNPDFADFSQSIGRGAVIATDEQLEQLGRLYWFTVEFGLIQEGSEIKAFGAGLLSSYGELEHAFGSEVERRRFNLKDVINTKYDYSDMQPLLFVIPSYAYLKDVTQQFISTFGRHADREVAPAAVPQAVW